MRKNFKLNYVNQSSETVELEISTGNILFLIGANGTGKSTLMHKFTMQHIGNARRITAHRQVWFHSDAVDLTPAGRQQTELNINAIDSQFQSRFKDDYAAQRSQVTIFDLIDSENVESRKIATALRAGKKEEAEKLASNKSPIIKMNEILKMANLHFQIEIVEGSRVMANRTGFEPYSIVELSDGERNALLIIANVLTAPEKTLILIDEPERHLHRSIVSPLLSTLLSYRNDCAFIISTHDVGLPLDQSKCSSLLIRHYQHTQQNWTADYIKSVEEMNEDTAAAILGSRRTLLFIEGRLSSLDLQIYQILFPLISIKPVGSCTEVEKIVKSLRSANKYHWLNTFGIIDKDNRSDEECSNLAAEGIIAIEQYSIESIYYHPVVVRGVLNRVLILNGGDNADEIIDDLNLKILQCITAHKERMVARIIERKAKDLLSSQSPSWKDIHDNKIEINFSVDSIKPILDDEKLFIDKLIENKNVAKIISKYPVRETPMLNLIAKDLKFQSQEEYEQAVRVMLLDSPIDKQNVLNLIKPVSDCFIF